MPTTRTDRHQAISEYKTLLRGYLEQRPSGIRQKIAQVLGTHKSFISQISNPSDATPIPARHLDAIIDVCHLSPTERKRFLSAYAKAHPEHQQEDNHRPHYKALHLQIPVLDDPAKQEAFEAFVRDSAKRLYELLK